MTAIRKELQLPPIGRTKPTPAPLAVSPHRFPAHHGAIGIESRNGHVVAFMAHHGPKGHATAAEIVKRYNDHDKLANSVRLAVDFLASLPPGWLGKTTADVGLLNDFYCTLPAEFRPAPPKR